MFVYPALSPFFSSSLDKKIMSLIENLCLQTSIVFREPRIPAWLATPVFLFSSHSDRFKKKKKNNLLCLFVSLLTSINTWHQAHLHFSLCHSDIVTGYKQPAEIHIYMAWKAGQTFLSASYQSISAKKGSKRNPNVMSGIKNPHRNKSTSRNSGKSFPGNEH